MLPAEKHYKELKKRRRQHQDTLKRNLRKINFFWSNLKHCEPTVLPTGCWEWKGSTFHNGYGRWGITLYGKRVRRTHQIAWILTHGRLLPDGKLIRHKCDNRLCCNPGHLELGTHQENMDDKRFRLRVNAPKGEAHGQSKLTEAQAQAILDSSEPGRVLATRYGIGVSLVSKIRHGQAWSHLKKGKPRG